MSADQPLAGDELATIKARAMNWDHPFRDDPETTLRLVAEIERLQAQVERATSCKECEGRNECPRCGGSGDEGEAWW